MSAPAMCSGRSTMPRAASTAGCRSRSTALAHDTAEAIAEAQGAVAARRPPQLVCQNPGHSGRSARHRAVSAEGISINVTLIFSLQRYAAVIEAFLDGMERARAAGRNLSTLTSVASFFVSRVDTEIDKRLDQIDTPKAAALKGKLRSPTPGWRTNTMSGFSPVTAGARWRRRAPAAAIVGLDRCQGSVL